VSPVEKSPFDTFYQRYAPYVMLCARARTSSANDAEDLQSIVWLDIYQQFDRFKVEEPRGQIHQLVRWRAIDLHRHLRADRYVQSTEEQLVNLLIEQVESVSEATQTNARLYLEQVLQSESSEDKEILVGRYIEEKTWEELAEQMAMHRNTVYRRAEACLKRLRQTIEEQRTE